MIFGDFFESIDNDFMTKMNCFCYEKQTLKAGAKEKYALVLLVDPNVTKNIKEAIIQFVYFKKWLLII